MLGTAAAMLLAGRLGIASTIEGSFFSPFWPLSGVALGCLLLGGPWMALGIYAGVAVHNALWDMFALTTWIGPLGIIFESGAAYWLMTRWLGARPRLEDLRGCLVFLLAPWLPVALNGVIGTFLIYTEQAVGPANLGRELGTFIMANGSGAALLAPAFAVWSSPPSAAWWRRMAVLSAVTAGAVWWFFFSAPAFEPYPLFVPLLAAAVMLGLRGTAPLIAGLAVLGDLAILRGAAPFAAMPRDLAVYGQLYTFLGLAAGCVLPVSAVVDQLRARLGRLERAGRSAGLVTWQWSPREGMRFDAMEDRCLAAVPPGHPHPGAADLFNGRHDRGLREAEVAGRPVLSFWEVGARDDRGHPAAVAGLVIDMSERLSLEQAERRAWQSEVELRNLRAGLAPHLLFNCLAAVRGIVRTDPERARSFIDHLSRFLRDSTDAQSRETVPLLDEWQLCEDFLELQSMRYERDLPRLVEIQGSAYHARIPPMMLLNLVENAVKHGEINQRHPLVITAGLRDGFLTATVRNHGKLGPPPASRPGGLGISRARLGAIYGSAATLDMREDGGDVIAGLRLPAAPPAATP